MGAVGGLLGLGGGAAGTSFAGPAQAPITNPTNLNQINTAYSGAQNSLQSQQNLLGALQAQNGLGNQSQVYGQLQGIANGTGPNPAQAMLNQSTGQNVANQSALMAGQRGAGSNVGLIARQAAQQGANTQQQAAGQAATLQANQSLNAINSAGNIANTQASNQIGQTNANTSAQQAEQQQLLGAQQGFNSAAVGSQSSINSANAGLAGQQMQGQQGLIGGALNGIGSIFAEGGEIKPMADGGGITPDTSAFSQSGPQSKFGKFLKGMNGGQSPANMAAAAPTTPQGQLKQGASSLTSGLINALKGSDGGSANDQTMAGGSDTPGASSDGPMVAAKGGEVPIVTSPGEKYLSPQAVKEVLMGASPMKVGKTIPGKPKVGGAKNSYDNDTVPMKAKAGAIIVPRSETKSKNPDRNSRDFVAKTLAKRKRK